ncbi:alanine--tRNA ligase [Mycoplasma sp. SG1]|uniref:alanine--tRNA ligase n=1 Tax=Mycoplasma sp. SG1 TaxID=2810348 RepID=UPI00202446F4|nr:alanine--tRNA ligase [Mycoplasma sp. SG1]URM53138.1 alanine--tRNA ligase [Mycoplasma sp. SG1]
MNHIELTHLFTDFFKSKKHLSLPSFSLIPNNDPSLLLINSGVAAMKKYFLNIVAPPCKRIVLAQNCVRTIDIAQVGKSPFHLTFFVMLGNFSFGDYFKKEAIDYGWEFLTKTLKKYIDPDKLYITAYKNDTEAITHWLNVIKINPKRLILREKKHNFWDLGQGPCGACTEVYYDLGKSFQEVDLDPDNLSTKLLEDDIPNNRYIEIWNIVFSEFNHLKDDTYKPLNSKNIDTGAGLERIYTILKGKASIFETDVFLPIINICDRMFKDQYSINFKIAFTKSDQIIQQKYTQDLCTIADHIRTAIYLIANNILPSNKGKGFVVRRLIRKILDIASDYCKDENIDDFLTLFVYQIFRDIDYFKFLVNIQSKITEILDSEQKIYQKTATGLIEWINKFFDNNPKNWIKINDQKINDQNIVNLRIAEKIFTLNTTYGFSKTKILNNIKENNLNISETRFNQIINALNILLENHKEISGAKVGKLNPMPLNELKDQILNKITFIPKTKKETDNQLIETQIIAAFKIDNIHKVDELIKNQKYYLLFEKSNFFPIGGGQISDTGTLSTNNDKIIGHILNVFTIDNWLLHEVVCINNFNISNVKLKLKIDYQQRMEVATNHTATHLLHALLKKINPLISQAGSLVEKKFLRFDYFHHIKLTDDELDWLEREAKKIIKLNTPRIETFQNLSDILNNSKIQKNYLEKYSSIVRVITFGDISSELCGGVHLKNLNEINDFLIFKNFSKSIDTQRIIIYTNPLYFHEGIKKEFDKIFKQQQIKLINELDSIIKEPEYKIYKSKKIFNNLIENWSLLKESNIEEKISKIKGYIDLKQFFENNFLQITQIQKNINLFKRFLENEKIQLELKTSNNIEKDIITTKTSLKIFFYKITDKKQKLKNLANILFNNKKIEIIIFTNEINENDNQGFEIINIYFTKDLEFNKFNNWFKEFEIYLKTSLKLNIPKIIYPIPDKTFALLKISDNAFSKNIDKIKREIQKNKI